MLCTTCLTTVLSVRDAPGLLPSMVKRERFRTAVHRLFDAVMCLTVLYVQRRHCGPCTCVHAISSGAISSDEAKHEPRDHLPGSKQTTSRRCGAAIVVVDLCLLRVCHRTLMHLAM